MMLPIIFKYLLKVHLILMTSYDDIVLVMGVASFRVHHDDRSNDLIAQTKLLQNPGQALFAFSQALAHFQLVALMQMSHAGVISAHSEAMLS
jgi:hypothetical protein